MMTDEKYLRQLNRHLAAQRHAAKKESQDQVNKDLQAVEQAFKEMRMAEIRRNFCDGEIKRLSETLREYETGHVSHTMDLEKWRITFEANLSSQKLDLASRMRALMLRHQDLMLLPVESDAEKEAQAAEQFKIGAQMGELRTKLHRLKSLLHFKTQEQIIVTVHPPDDMEEFDLPKLECMDRMICANTRCGRVKISKTHPLCRNCQKLYAEGKIGGEWTGIVLADPLDE